MTDVRCLLTVPVKPTTPQRELPSDDHLQSLRKYRSAVGGWQWGRVRGMAVGARDTRLGSRAWGMNYRLHMQTRTGWGGGNADEVLAQGGHNVNDQP